MANLKSGFTRIGVVASGAWVAFVLSFAVVSYFESKSEATDLLMRELFADLTPNPAPPSPALLVPEGFELILVEHPSKMVVCTKTKESEVNCKLKPVRIAQLAFLPLAAMWSFVLLLFFSARWVYRGFRDGRT